MHILNYKCGLGGLFWLVRGVMVAYCKFSILVLSIISIVICIMMVVYLYLNYLGYYVSH